MASSGTAVRSATTILMANTAAKVADVDVITRARPLAISRVESWAANANGASHHLILPTPREHLSPAAVPLGVSGRMSSFGRVVPARPVASMRSCRITEAQSTGLVRASRAPRRDSRSLRPRREPPRILGCTRLSRWLARERMGCPARPRRWILRRTRAAGRPHAVHGWGHQVPAKRFTSETFFHTLPLNTRVPRGPSVNDLGCLVPTVPAPIRAFPAIHFFQDIVVGRHPAPPPRSGRAAARPRRRCDCRRSSSRPACARSKRILGHQRVRFRRGKPKPQASEPDRHSRSWSGVAREQGPITCSRSPTERFVACSRATPAANAMAPNARSGSMGRRAHQDRSCRWTTSAYRPAPYSTGVRGEGRTRRARPTRGAGAAESPAGWLPSLEIAGTLAAGVHGPYDHGAFGSCSASPRRRGRRCELAGRDHGRQPSRTKWLAVDCFSPPPPFAPPQLPTHHVDRALRGPIRSPRANPSRRCPLAS